MREGDALGRGRGREWMWEGREGEGEREGERASVEVLYCSDGFLVFGGVQNTIVVC